MPWRIHLANHAIPYLAILGGTQPALLAELGRHQLGAYDLESGAELGRNAPTWPSEPMSLGDERWRGFISSLRILKPKLPIPRFAIHDLTIFQTVDSLHRVVLLPDGGLMVESEGKVSLLDTRTVVRWLDIQCDAVTGFIAGFDQDGGLHLFNREQRIGTFLLGFKESDYRLALARGGQRIYASDGRELLVLNGEGTVEQRAAMPYRIGHIACSPSGAMIALSDASEGIIRVYRATDLMMTHYKFAMDLIEEASQRQLIEELPPMNTAVSALAAHAQGVVAFAMSGVVCVSDTQHMNAMPNGRRP